MINILKKRFLTYKDLGDKTLCQLSDSQIFWQYNEESNSIAILVKHIAGNMLSRWTHFLTEDGEKTWRNRDQEFINTFKTKQEVLDYWEKGWQCLLDALESMNDDNIFSIIYIRGEPHSVLDAVLRQLAHYPYHIGQMIYIAKMLKNTDWQSLSVPRDQSENFNQEMFSKYKEDKG